MFLIYDVDPLAESDCFLGYTVLITSTLTRQLQPEDHLLKFLQDPVSNSQMNEGGAQQKNIYSIMTFLGAHVPHTVQGLPTDFFYSVS